MQQRPHPALHEQWVICLCAQWCGACREWRDLFEQAAAAHPDLRFGWVDVEDEAAAMGDVDIETFPTLLVADGARPLFFGPVQPSAAQLSRLLASLLREGAAPSGVTAETSTLLTRLSSVLLKQ
jgi:thioredoxin-like negative regulator of GroEL